MYATPRTSTREGSMNMSGSGTDDDFEEPYPHEERSMTRPPIAGRRNLRNWRFEKPRTDFQTWEQAENALQNGATVKDLVHREFVSDFGSQAVRSAPAPRKHLVYMIGWYSKHVTVFSEIGQFWVLLCAAVTCRSAFWSPPGGSRGCENGGSSEV